MTQTAAVNLTALEAALEAWCDCAIEDVIPDCETGATTHFWDDPRPDAEDVVDVAFGTVWDRDGSEVLTAAWGHLVDDNWEITDQRWEQSAEREQAVRFCMRYLVNEMSKKDEEEASLQAADAAIAAAIAAGERRYRQSLLGDEA